MKGLALTAFGAFAGAVLMFVLTLFFEEPPSRAEFVEVKVKQQTILDDIKEIKGDVKILLRRVH